MSPRTRARVVGGGMLVLALIAAGVFVLPFAFPTPAPIVTRFGATLLFSPNADGRRDTARVSVRVREPSTVTVQVRGPDGIVRKILDGETLPVGFTRPVWDGTDDDGLVVADGTYALEIRARRGQRQFNTSRKIVVDTRAPETERFEVRSAALAGPGVGQCRISLVARTPAAAAIEILSETDGGARARRGPRPLRAGGEIRWAFTGRTAAQRSLPPGLYTVRATLSDPAGNQRVRAETCWVGHAIGTARPREAAPGDRVGVTLTDIAGGALPSSTRVQLALYRRTGTPGRTLRAPLGARVGGQARGRMDQATVRLPRRIRADALWLVAAADGRRALVPLGGR